MDQLTKALELFLRDNPHAGPEDFFSALKAKPGAQKKAVRVPRRRRSQMGQPRPVWYVAGAKSPDQAVDRLLVSRRLP